MKRRRYNYRIFEGLRVATCLTFISGYLNAFTFITQHGIFAGVQSGNVIMWSYHLAQGHWKNVLDFTIPIIFFMLGQCLTYLARGWLNKYDISWHFAASLMMLTFAVLTAVLIPILPTYVIMASVALTASIQVETFSKLRGAPYANVMMTGNVKNAAMLTFKGFMEKNKDLQKQGRNIFIIMAGFALGVATSTILSNHLGNHALGFVILPMLYVTTKLWEEKKWEAKKA